MALGQEIQEKAVSLRAGEIAGGGFELKRHPLLLCMFAGILLSNLLLLTKNYYWDGITFSLVIEQATGLNSTLLHPNHLIYNVVGYLLYRAARGIGLQPRAVEVLQILNCLVSTLSAYVFFRILLNCFKSIYLSVILTLLFAFSATWWKFSTDADSYILSVFFLLLSFYLILPQRKPKPLLVALTHTLSMLFHQLALLFFPVIVLGILLQASQEPARRRFTLVLQYALTAFLITFSLFCFSFYLITGSLDFQRFLRWITNFSPEHGFTFNAWNNLTYTLRGHSRLFVGGRLGFLRDLKDPWMFALAGVVLIVAALFFFKLIRHFGELKTFLRAAVKNNGQYKNLRLLTIVWIICYLVFLFFFIPQNTFYRLFYLPAIIVLVGSFLASYEAASNRGPRRYRAALFVALAACANLTFSAYPYAQVRANPPLALALELNKSWPPGTLIYLASWNSDNQMVKYFNPSTNWKLVNQETFEKEIPDLQGSQNSIWMDTTLIEHYQNTPEGRSWLEAHTMRRPEYELVNSKYKLMYYELKPDSFNGSAKTKSP